MTHLSRRSLIGSLISLVAAPAIVRAGSLMPVKIIPPPMSIEELLRLRIADAERVMMENIKTVLYGDRYLGISGASNKVYVSETFTLRGVELRFDPICPRDTIYLLPGVDDDPA